MALVRTSRNKAAVSVNGDSVNQFVTARYQLALTDAAHTDRIISLLDVGLRHTSPDALYTQQLAAELHFNRGSIWSTLFTIIVKNFTV